MKLTDNYILQEDLDRIVRSNVIPFELFKGTTVFITGATGLLGTQMVLALLNANAELNLNLKVFALVRNKEKAEAIYKYADKAVLKFVIGDVGSEIKADICPDYIIHAASPTDSKYFVEHPVDTIFTAVHGSENLLEFAKKKSVKSFVYLSSLEVYGTADFNGKPIKENMYGAIDSMSVRSSYSESKKLVECLCSSYASQYKVPVKVARLCQTFGPGVGYDDGRVFAQFARSIIEGKDIVLKTDGSTERNYCYTADAISAILMILLSGKNGEAYNVANKNTFISIKNMAQMLTEQYPESGTKLVFDIAEDVTKLGYNPKVVINLDTQKIEKLGWKAETDLQEMFERLIRSMKYFGKA